MKRYGHTIKSQSTRHVQSYLNGNSILSIARKCNYPPSMMARLIVENVAVLPAAAAGNTTIRHGNVNTMQRKFITEAIRYPEKVLGDASSSVTPEYLFSEGKGSKQNRRDDVLEDKRCVPLSRLSIEVREAVSSDPMYGEFIWLEEKCRFNLGCSC